MMGRDVENPSKDFPFLDTTICKLIKKYALISAESQYHEIKCTLLSNSSKFTQEFLKSFHAFLSKSSSISQDKCIAYLKVFNNLLEAINYLISVKMSQGKPAFFIESQITSDGIFFINAVDKIPKSETINRQFEYERQKFFANYMTLLSIDSSINSTPEYLKLAQEGVDRAVDMIESNDINDCEGLYELLRAIYVPAFIKSVEDSSLIDAKMNEYHRILNSCISALLEAEISYTFSNITKLFEFAFNEAILTCEKISTHPTLYKAIKDVIRHSEKNPFLLRVLVNQIVKTLYNFPERAIDYLKLVKKLLSKREYRGFEAELYDKMTRKKSDMQIELVSLIPTIASYHSAYTRLYMLVFVSNYVDLLLKKIEEWKVNRSDDLKELISKMKLFIEKLMIECINSQVKGNPKDIAMPYSDGHRKRTHLSQAMCIMMKLVNHKTYIEDFSRELGFSIEILDYLDVNMWKILKYNNLPSIRQYQENSALNYMNQFADRTLGYVEKEIGNKSLTSQFIISLSFITGYYIATHIESENSRTLFKYFFPLVASNVAYVRAVAQYFSTIYLKKHQTLVESHPIMKQFFDVFIHNDQKLNMCKKLDEIMVAFRAIIHEFDIKMLLTY